MPRVRASQEAEELQAEILGLIAERDATVPEVLYALASALGQYASEHLTHRQQERVVDNAVYVIEQEMQ